MSCNAHGLLFGLTIILFGFDCINAKYIKLADKISNIRDITENPPDGWSDERRLEYINWGERVIDGLRGVNANLENHFDELVKAARKTIEKPQIQNIN